MAQQSSSQSPEAPPRDGPLALIAWCVGLAGVGWAVWTAIGAPPLPDHAPGWAEVRAAMTTPTLPGDSWPYRALLVVVIWALWATWAWLALSLALGLLEALAERRLPGLAPAIRALADRAAHPVARQAARAALAVGMATATLPRPQPAAATPPAAVVRAVEPRPASMAPLTALDRAAVPGLAAASPAATAPTPDRPARADDGVVRHVVRDGETLARLVEWHTGSPGNLFRVAGENGIRNPGRLAAGRVITITGAERTDPMPAAVAPAGPGERTHVVARGEYLRLIAERAYGHERHWPLIYRRNWAAIADPDVIYTGQVLVLPAPPGRQDEAAPAEQPAAEAEPAAAAEPAPAPPVAATSPVDWPVSDRYAPALAPSPAVAPPPGAAVIDRPARAEGMAASPVPDARSRVPLGAPHAAADATPPASATPDDSAPAEERRADDEVAAPVPLDPQAATLAALGLAVAVLAARGAATFAERRRRGGSPPPAAPCPSPPSRPLALRGALLAAAGRADRLARGTLHALRRRRARAGGRADARLGAAVRLRDVLARAGWPTPVIVSVTDGERRLECRVDPGAPAEGAADQTLPELLREVEAGLGAPVAGEVTGDGHLVLTLSGVEPSESEAADTGDEPVPPTTPLLHIGHTGDGFVSVAPAALGGGLLLAGAGALTALESALLGLVATYPAGTLRLALIGPPALTAPLASLPHLIAPPAVPVSPAGRALLATARAELDGRRPPPAGVPAPLVLAIAGPAALDGPALRELLADGAAAGVSVALACEEPTALDPDLLDRCPARWLGRLPTADLSRRLAGRAGAEALASGEAWWLLAGEEPRSVTLLVPDPAARRALLASLEEARAEADVSAEPHPDREQAEPAAPAGAADVSGAKSTFVALEGVDASDLVPLTPPAGALAVWLLGAPRITGPDGAEIRLDGMPKALELLTYLALHPEGTAKETIAEALWPEVSNGRKQREALYKVQERLNGLLRGLLGDDGPDPIAGAARGAPYRLDVPSLWTDVGAVRSHLALAGRLTRAHPEQARRAMDAALALYGGRLGGEATYDWAEPLAEELAADVARLGVWAADLAARAGQPREALCLYGRLRALAVYHGDDRVFRAELRSWAAAGDRLGLEKAMRDYTAWLRRDYAVEPEDETLALFDTLRQEITDERPQDSAAATAD